MSQLETCVGEIKEIADARLDEEKKKKIKKKSQPARAEEGGSQSGESAMRVRNFCLCDCTFKRGH